MPKQRGFGLPVVSVPALLGIWFLASLATGEPKPAQSVSAMLGKLSPAQQQIADRARDLYDVVAYGPGGPISNETPVLGPILEPIARACVMAALYQLQAGHTVTPAQLAIEVTGCQTRSLERNGVARELGVYVQLFGPSP